MDDKELNKVLKVHSEAWRQYVSVPTIPRMEPKLSTDVRAAINKLRTEARHVPDPGGLFSNYSDALAAWAAASHPEIDWLEMNRYVVDKLIFDHR